MRWSVVRQFVDRLEPATILEIGCGQGAFGARLSTRADYLAVEPDATSFAVAKGRIESAGGRIRNATSDAIGDESTYDLVCAFEVLEHLENDAAALKSWRTLVAPGGHVLLSMPAWQERFNHWDAMVGHYRRYSPDQCRDLLAEAGFAEVTVLLYGWPLGYLTENVRSRIAARRAAAPQDSGAASMQERTARSGRLLQPKAVAGVAVQLATSPFIALQRLRPTHGTGLVVCATRSH
ncbi:MAG TPA: class I SAM-dependent methyltransferase [Candidatus Limnocylindrales bacterium]|jgi:SAM-dependent methyltransferase